MAVSAHYACRMRVSAFVGTIVAPALGAHAIVNASNPELGLGSGVSGAIRETCGGSAWVWLERGLKAQVCGSALQRWTSNLA